MRISDWSSDVCSSDLGEDVVRVEREGAREPEALSVVPCQRGRLAGFHRLRVGGPYRIRIRHRHAFPDEIQPLAGEVDALLEARERSEERRVGQECGSTCRSRWWRHK